MKKFLFPLLASLCIVTSISLYASSTPGSYNVYSIVVNGLPSDCMPDIEFNYWTTSMEGDQYVQDLLDPYAATYNLGPFWNMTMNGVPLTQNPGTTEYISNGNVVCFCCSDCKYYCVTATLNTLSHQIIFDAVQQPNHICTGSGCHPPN